MDPFLSALDLAAAIPAKRLSPVEVVDAYLARIDRIDPELNAVTWRRDDVVRAEARAAEQALMRGEASGPFFGVPLPVKDLTFVTGWPITFGSKAGLNHVAGFTSTVIQRYIDAGFLLLCRTNTPEFGIMCVTENHAWGATRNPWDVRRTPGGSSGGAAAAVAAGLAPVAHASDGGGSIRIPASCCGLVGLKPSRGRVSSGPFVSDVMNGGAVEGCVSRTVADTAAIYDVLGETDHHAWYNAPRFERSLREEVGRPPGRLRIAWTTTPPTGGRVDPACRDAVARAARLLEDLGHDVFEGAPSWPDPTDAIDTFLTLWNTNIAYWPIDDWDAVEPLSAADARGGRRRVHPPRQRDRATGDLAPAPLDTCGGADRRAAHRETLGRGRAHSAGEPARSGRALGGAPPAARHPRTVTDGRWVMDGRAERSSSGACAKERDRRGTSVGAARQSRRGVYWPVSIGRIVSLA